MSQFWKGRIGTRIPIILPLLVAGLLSCIFLSLSCEYRGRGYRYKHGGAYIGSSPSMSLDGLKIVFGSPRTGNGDIYVMNSDGTNWVRLTDTITYDGEPKFSPDGSKIVFISERDGNGEIYIMNADGSSPKRLTQSDDYKSTPSFSPDGSRIIFTRSIPLKGSYYKFSKIFVMNADGSGQQRVTKDDALAHEISPSLAPDGKKICYEREKYDRDKGTTISEIWITNTDGSQSICLMKGEVSSPKFSPVGDLIVYISTRDTDYSVDPYTKCDLWIMNLNGSTQCNQLTYTKSYKSTPVFSPDGKKIIFLEVPEPSESAGKGQIRIMNIDGSEVKTIANNY